MKFKAAFITTLLLCQLLLSNNTSANEPISPVTLNLGEKVTLTSKVMGNQRELYVRLPPGYSESKQHYPVIYLLDANLTYVKNMYFHSIALIDRMEKNGSTGDIPQSIVIGLPNESFGQWHQETTGKPEVLARYLVEELKPWVKENYRTLDNQVLIGQSYSGSMILGALARYPGSFDTVIAADSIFTGQSAMEQTISVFEKTPKAPSNNRPLIYAVQSEKEDTDVLFLKKSLAKSNPGAVNIIRETFLLENHSTVIYQAINNGLRRHFDDYKRPSHALLATKDFKYADIVDFFAKRDKKYQLTTTDKYLKSSVGHVAYYYLTNKRFALAWPLYDMNENKRYVKYIINRIAQRLFNKNDFQDALTVWTHLSKQFPDLPTAQHGLGKVYEKLNQKDQALAAYKKAVELATAQKDEDLADFKASLKRFKEAQ